MYNKRIVVDLDDTISATIDRDFENAKPIKQVIEKVNYFYSIGFEIIIQTARGQISCNGDSVAADKKYRLQIESWLESNGVNYHKLDFNKILAQFYIDDKSLTPKVFSNTITEEMRGKSGDYVLRVGDYVYKTTKGAKDELNWYSISESRFTSYKTPKINSLVGETICMEFIEDNKCDKEFTIIPQIKKILSEFSGASVSNGGWDSYIKRVLSHLIKNDLPLNIARELDCWGGIMESESSFSHGDLTLENIIKNDSIYLIDSIFNKSLYSSWLIDLSKLLYSYRSKGRFDEYNYLFNYYINKTGYDQRLFILLESTHWVRVYSYLTNEYEKNRYLKQIKEYDEFFK